MSWNWFHEKSMDRVILLVFSVTQKYNFESWTNLNFWQFCLAYIWWLFKVLQWLWRVLHLRKKRIILDQLAFLNSFDILKTWNHIFSYPILNTMLLSNEPIDPPSSRSKWGTWKRLGLNCYSRHESPSAVWQGGRNTTYLSKLDLQC